MQSSRPEVKGPQEILLQLGDSIKMDRLEMSFKDVS
jgi:hypothetical protein